MAAKKQFVHAEPTCLSYEFVTPEILEGTSKELRTEQLRMLTDLEIRKELEKAVEDLGPDPVQVVFANQRCEDCGQVSLLNAYYYIHLVLIVFLVGELLTTLAKVLMSLFCWIQSRSFYYPRIKKLKTKHFLRFLSVWPIATRTR